MRVILLLESVSAANKELKHLCFNNRLVSLKRCLNTNQACLLSQVWMSVQKQSCSFVLKCNQHNDDWVGAVILKTAFLGGLQQQGQPCNHECRACSHSQGAKSRPSASDTDAQSTLWYLYETHSVPVSDGKRHWQSVSIWHWLTDIHVTVFCCRLSVVICQGNFTFTLINE